MPPGPRGDDDWLLVGIVSAPFGVHGEVRIEVLTEFPTRFLRLRALYLGEEKRAVALERAHTRGKSGVALKLAGYDTPEQAAALRQTPLYIPRGEAMPLPAGRYYVDQIVGLEARLLDGRVLGRVSEVLPIASNDVYVVDGGEHGQILLPAIRDVIKEINLPGGYLAVEPLPGLLPPSFGA
ncbi:MAG: ribosome maturation factor RimM [Chloroflexota bacterium]